MTDTTTNKATIEVSSTDSNTATVVFKNKDSDTIDTAVISTQGSEEYTLKYEDLLGTHNVSGNICIEKAGRFVLCKGINLSSFKVGNTAVKGSTNGWYMCTDFTIPEDYRPNQREWFYNSAFVSVEPKSNVIYTYPVSIVVTESGQMGFRLERSQDLTKNPTTISGLNFTIMWIIYDD